jgi:hypothetical protein
VTFEIPATIACADAGDIVAADRHLAAAERSAANWEGSAWPAAVREAQAHVAAVRGNLDGARALLAEAADLFTVAGQQLDASRCSDPAEVLPALAPMA